MWEKMDLFCKTLPMPVTVVITYIKKIKRP